MSSEYASCPIVARLPNMDTVGRFVQQTVHGAVNVVKQRTVQRLKLADFARDIKPESLYAAFASFRERGDRSYLLLLVACDKVCS